MPTSVLAALAKDATLQDALAILDAIRDKPNVDTTQLEAIESEVRDRLPTALVQGALPDGADAQVTGVVSGVGSVLQLDVPQGYRSFSFIQSAVGTNGTWATEWSPDDGTTWAPLYSVSNAGSNANIVSSTQVSPNSWNGRGSIPAGATHIRVRCSAWTSGAPTFILSASSKSESSVISVGALPTVTLGGGTSTIGMVRGQGLWVDETAALLAAGGTFTGVARDLVNSVSGAALGSSMVAREARFGAVSDVAGTLSLEISRDNTNWRRVQDEVLTQRSASGLYVGTIDYDPFTRYVRCAYTNGATAQGHFMLETLLLSI